MKKGTLAFLCLIVLTDQLYGLQYTQDSSFFFADALIWKFKEGVADNWAQKISPVGTNRTAELLEVPFKWDAGLRLGAGYNHFYQDWDIVFSYTGFKTKGVSQAAVTSGGIYSPFLGNFFINNTNGRNFGPNYRNASIDWKVFFNIFDLEIGRTFEIDQFLALRPFIGLKGGTINQNIASTWENPTVATTFTSATENLKNNFFGIGPSIGVDTTYALYKTNQGVFNLFGNFSGSVLRGHWRFKDLYQNNTPTSVAINISPINGAATMARALVGVEWLGSISKAKVSVRLGYEAQVWFNQVQYYSFNMGRLNNLMSLQGGVLGFNVYF